jgi:hypothetical protein
MPVGTATVDFGTPGRWEASVTVTGQGSIVSSSKVEPFVMATASSDHSADEHRAEQIKATAGAIVDGVGFTIWANATGNRPLRGQWTIHWVWV